MIHRLAWCCMTLWAGFWSPQSGGPVLDLREFQEPAEARTRGWGGGGGWVSTRDGSTNELVPFDVTLSLDKADYEVGDELSYTIVLRSLSPERVILPWQPDWRIVEKGHENRPPGYVAAAFGLTLHWGGETKRVFLQAIQGSRLVEGSLQAVEPGEEVRILGRFKWISEVLSPLLASSGDSHWTVQV
ncbi:MAG: hypothetical protein V3T83_05135, partial [Acidobacteriota bacterium]